MKKRFFSLDSKEVNIFKKNVSSSFRSKTIRDFLNGEYKLDTEAIRSEENSELELVPFRFDQKEVELLDQLSDQYQNETGENGNRSKILRDVIRQFNAAGNKFIADKEEDQSVGIEINAKMKDELKKILGGYRQNRAIEDYILNDYRLDIRRLERSQKPYKKYFVTMSGRAFEKLDDLVIYAKKKGVKNATRTLIFEDIFRLVLKKYQDQKKVSIEQQLGNLVKEYKDYSGGSEQEIKENIERYFLEDED